MPRIVDYPEVTKAMTARGFVSLYHNSGAFGYAAGSTVHVAGWIGPEDPSIRPAAMRHARRVGAPYDQNLADTLVRACEGAVAWLMPKSHWHYELHFGNRELLEEVLRELKIDPALLVDRNDGSAIEFTASERELLRETARRLLGRLRGSDFLVALPDRATVCTIHHHQQLWLQTTDETIVRALRA